MRVSILTCIIIMIFKQILFAAPASGTGLEVGSSQSIKVIVEDPSGITISHGITEQQLLDKIEIRLRRNGIYPSDKLFNDYFLYLNLGTTENSYSFTLEFIRNVNYSVDGTEYSINAPVWITNGFGLNGDQTKFRNDVFDAILDRVDRFSNEYLKVNSTP